MLSKKDQTKKMARLKEPVFKDPKYLDYLHNNLMPGCAICGLPTIELHHLDRGIGARDDRTVVPLCPMHHRESPYSAHGFSARQFMIDNEDLLWMTAEGLYSQYLEWKG